jgi:hypothetical protein
MKTLAVPESRLVTAVASYRMKKHVLNRKRAMREELEKEI